MRWFQAMVGRLWRHWVSLLGSLMTTLAGLSILVVAAADVLGLVSSGYAAVYLLGALAVMLVVGLLLIPVGLALGRRPGADDGTESVIGAVLRSAPTMRRAAFVVVATVMNLLLLALAGEKSVREMNSPLFCGTACHIPMQPEWESYQVSPHKQVACVDCHVGSGVSHAIKAKLEGTRRLRAMMTGDFTRPIPTPVHGMRAASETCQRCHDPGVQHGNRVKVYPRFQEDRDNTPAYNVAQLFLGGPNARSGRFEGIHAHGDGTRRIEFDQLDEQRHRIGKIRVYEGSEKVAEYARPGDQGDVVATRTMDCMDCHNRPTHQFVPDAVVAVDQALHDGALDRTVPWIRKAAVELLGKEAPTREGAPAHFVDALKASYARQWPDEKVEPAALEKAGRGVAALYLRNVFPDMKVGFGTYRSHTDHRDAQDKVGCFRCHNSDYEAIQMKAGREGELAHGCEACHVMLATEENPADMEDTVKVLVDAPK